MWVKISLLYIETRHHAVNEPCKDDDMAKLAEIADVIFTATPQGFCASQVTEDILSKTKIID